MTITINVSRESALAAVCYHLQLGGKITSKAKFINSVTNYIEQWGESSEDDHITEGEDFIEKSEKIVDKYFEIV